MAHADYCGKPHDLSISDIRISLASDEDWGANRMETTLEEGESADIDLGEFTEAELTNDGFNIRSMEKMANQLIRTMIRKTPHSLITAII